MPRKSSSSSTARRRSTSRSGKRTNTGRTASSNSARGSSRRSSGSSTSSSGSTSSSLSPRTRKAIDTLPSHAQKIYTKAHKNALKQYSSPSKRRGGKRQSKGQVAHRVASSALKKEYKKKCDKW